MSEKYSTNINSIEEAIKQLEDLKIDRLSFVTGDKEHDNIFLKDVQAIEIVLSNLEALCDMQRTADRQLKSERKINEEHKKEIGELRERVKDLEKKNKEILNSNVGVDLSYDDYIPEQKIKDKIEEIKQIRRELGFKTYLKREDMINEDREIVIRIKVLEELLQEKNK